MYKNYKIVAFYGINYNKDKVYEIVNNQCFAPNGEKYDMLTINLDKHEIHTIEDLKTGELISIGDKSSSGKVKRIIPVDNTVFMYHGINSGPNLSLDEFLNRQNLIFKNLLLII